MSSIRVITATSPVLKSAARTLPFLSKPASVSLTRFALPSTPSSVTMAVSVSMRSTRLRSLARSAPLSRKRRLSGPSSPSLTSAPRYAPFLSNMTICRETLSAA